MSVERYDEMAHVGIRKIWQQMELSLFTSKWFDYRFMHPSEATYLYAHHWERVYRRFYKMNVDAQRADVIKVFNKSNIFKDKANLPGLWRGRQHADGLGIPYDLYITLAFKENLRFWNRSHLPRPQHCYSGRVIEAIQQAWPEHQAANLFYSRLPTYHNDNYAETNEQKAHHEWLMDQAGRRAAPAWVLGKFVKDGILPIEKIVARFGDDMPEKIALAA